jgi:hypothetical protein
VIALVWSASVACQSARRSNAADGSTVASGGAGCGEENPASDKSPDQSTGPGDKHLPYRTAVVVLAAVRVGPIVNKLVALTRYDTKFVEDISLRMRLSGLWSDTQVRSDHWVHDGNDTIEPAVFWSDVLVAQGFLMAQPEGPIRVRYWVIKDHENRKPKMNLPKRQ